MPIMSKISRPCIRLTFRLAGRPLGANNFGEKAARSAQAPSTPCRGGVAGDSDVGNSATTDTNIGAAFAQLELFTVGL